MLPTVTMNEMQWEQAKKAWLLSYGYHFVTLIFFKFKDVHFPFHDESSLVAHIKRI